jgi:hypothetical protein
MLAAGRPYGLPRTPRWPTPIPHSSQQVAAALTRTIWAAGLNTTSQLTVAGVLASPPSGRSLVVDTAADGVHQTRSCLGLDSPAMDVSPAMEDALLKGDQAEK